MSNAVGNILFMQARACDSQSEIGSELNRFTESKRPLHDIESLSDLSQKYLYLALCETLFDLKGEALYEPAMRLALSFGRSLRQLYSMSQDECQSVIQNLISQLQPSHVFLLAQSLEQPELKEHFFDLFRENLEEDVEELKKRVDQQTYVPHLTMSPESQEYRSWHAYSSPLDDRFKNNLLTQLEKMVGLKRSENPFEQAEGLRQGFQGLLSADHERARSLLDVMTRAMGMVAQKQFIAPIQERMQQYDSEIYELFLKVASSAELERFCAFCEGVDLTVIVEHEFEEDLEEVRGSAATSSDKPRGLHRQLMDRILADKMDDEEWETSTDSLQLLDDVSFDQGEPSVDTYIPDDSDSIHFSFSDLDISRSE